MEDAELDVVATAVQLPWVQLELDLDTVQELEVRLDAVVTDWLAEDQGAVDQLDAAVDLAVLWAIVADPQECVLAGLEDVEQDVVGQWEGVIVWADR